MHNIHAHVQYVAVHVKRVDILTKMLSGLMSPCSIEDFLRSLSASSSCCVYERTALMCSPTSLPYFLSTSRKFMLTTDSTQQLQDLLEIKTFMGDESEQFKYVQRGTGS